MQTALARAPGGDLTLERSAILVRPDLEPTEVSGRSRPPLRSVATYRRRSA
jgi:hypothetical protein